jgi:hypothetical protein
VDPSLLAICGGIDSSSRRQRPRPSHHTIKATSFGAGDMTATTNFPANARSSLYLRQLCERSELGSKKVPAQWVSYFPLGALDGAVLPVVPIEFPDVPWLNASLVFGPGEPPVPLT